jgi:hypothetical protein
LILLLVGFTLPFVTIANDTPGGFGRVGEGGTTTYTGLDLATGTEPRITAGSELPAEEQREDTLAPQPLVLLAAAGLIGAAVASLMIVDVRRRHLVSAISAVATAAVLATGQWMSQLRLTDRLTDQLNAGDIALAGDRTPGDFVSSAFGFWVIAAGLIVLAAVDLVLLWRDDSRSTEIRGREDVSRNLQDAVR